MVNAIALLRIAAGREVLWVQDRLGPLTLRAVYNAGYNAAEISAILLLVNSITALILWGVWRAGFFGKADREDEGCF